MYVISCTNESNNSKQYYALDTASGGYPFFTKSFSLAKIFTEYQKALDVFNDKELDDRRHIVMVSGNKYPTTLIYGALNLSCEKTKEVGILAIEEIKLRVETSKKIFGEISKEK